MAKSIKRGKRSKAPNSVKVSESDLNSLKSKVEVHTLSLARTFFKGELQKDPRALKDVHEAMRRLSTAVPSREGAVDSDGNVIEMTNYINAGGCRKHKVREVKIDHGNKPIRLFVAFDNNAYVVAHAMFKKSDGSDYIRECDKVGKKLAQYKRDGEHIPIAEIMPILGEAKQKPKQNKTFKYQ
ncbi:hypothetical protein VCHA53O466_50386 [Vibrio chagasii]|nr:hypothetical protein VCHA53O466_50386 [Vibrio chagasii]